MDEPRNQDFGEFVQQKENLFRWALSDEQLMLSTGILPEDVNNKRWKPINNEWQDVLPNFKSIVREKPREAWLDELAKLCERRFDQDYRGIGGAQILRDQAQSAQRTRPRNPAAA